MTETQRTRGLGPKALEQLEAAKRPNTVTRLALLTLGQTVFPVSAAVADTGRKPRRAARALRDEVLAQLAAASLRREVGATVKDSMITAPAAVPGRTAEGDAAWFAAAIANQAAKREAEAARLEAARLEAATLARERQRALTLELKTVRTTSASLPLAEPSEPVPLSEAARARRLICGAAAIAFAASLGHSALPLIEAGFRALYGR